MRLTRLPLLLLVIAAWGQWDRFRGPNGTGVADGSPLPSEFGAGKNLAWRRELPPGHSSPIVTGGRIYLTATEHDRIYTLALDAQSGQILWKQEAPRPRREKLHSLNNPASPSPAADADNLYVFFTDFGILS